MPSATVKGVSLDKPGNSLAVWLAGHHPDIFLAAYQKARQTYTAQQIRRKGLKGLGQDDVTSFDAGTSTTFDTSSAFDTSSFDPSSLPDPPLETVTFDVNEPAPNLLTDATSDGSGFLSSISGTPTASGFTVGGALSSVGSNILGAIGAVGKFLNTPAGQTTVSNLARTSATPVQQQTIQTQVGRTAANQLAAPITYQNGVPVYVTPTAQGAVYQPLTAQNLQQLTPAKLTQFLSQYGLWVLAAGLALLLFRRSNMREA